MLRKVIQLGDETLVVSLPSAWARQHKLKKGDEIEAEEQGPRLLIYPIRAQAGNMASVDVSGTEPVTKRIIGALYKAGYDEIEVLFSEKKELDIIESTIRNELAGFEVVNKAHNKIVARAVSRPIEEEFDNLLRRVFLLLLEVASECAKGITTPAKLLAAAELDRDINRHVNFCRRTLNSSGHMVAKRVAPAYVIVEQLERIGDNYKKLCMLLSEAKEMPGPTVSECLAECNSLLRKFYELYYAFNLLKMAEFWKQKENIEKKISEALKTAGKNDSLALMHISEAIANISDANGALLTSFV